jgi:hypothetical protein
MNLIMYQAQVTIYDLWLSSVHVEAPDQHIGVFATVQAMEDEKKKSPKYRQKDFWHESICISLEIDKEDNCNVSITHVF